MPGPPGARRAALHRIGDRYLRMGCGAGQDAGLTRGCHPHGGVLPTIRHA